MLTLTLPSRKFMAWSKLVFSLVLFILSIASFPHWKGMYDFAVISPNTETNTVASIGIMRFPQFFVYRDVSYNWATMGGDAVGNLKGGSSADRVKKLADNDATKYKNSRKRFKELNLILPQKGDLSQKASLDINIRTNAFTASNVHSSAVSLYNVDNNGQTTANTAAFVQTPFTYTAGTKPSQTHEREVYEFYTKLEEACKTTTATTDTKCVALTKSIKPQIVSNELHPWKTDTSNKPKGTSRRDFKYEKFNEQADCITKFGAKLGLSHTDNGNYWLKQDGDMDKGELGAHATVNAYNAICRPAAFTPKCQCKAQGSGAKVGQDATDPGLVTNFQEGKKDFDTDSDTGTYLFNKKGPNMFLWKDTSWGAAIMFAIIFIHSVASPYLTDDRKLIYSDCADSIWNILEILVYLWQWVVIVCLLMHLSAHNTMAFGFTSFLSESQEFAPDTLIRIEGPINDYKIAIVVFAFFLVFVDTMLFWASTKPLREALRNCCTSSDSKTTTVGTEFGF